MERIELDKIAMRTGIAMLRNFADRNEGTINSTLVANKIGFEIALALSKQGEKVDFGKVARFATDPEVKKIAKCFCDIGHCLASVCIDKFVEE